MAGVFLAALLAMSGAETPPNAAPQPPLSPGAARAYTVPHQMVEVAPGRRLNLFCMGSGKQTVLFEAGGSDWSVVWALVQPKVAAHTRACAYDRAGLGYSDPALGPRSPIAIVEDLRSLIHAAGLNTPLVLVGHSLGGFNVKLYAALYPEDVAGLVLVDPAEERTWARTREAMHKQFGTALAGRAELLDHRWLELLMERYRRCEKLAVAGTLDPASDNYRRCSDAPRPILGDDIAKERGRLQTSSAYQAAQASEILNSVYGVEANDAVYASIFKPHALGQIPLIVLTHGSHDPADPLDVLSLRQGVALHEQTARLSRKGRQQTVRHAQHYIELDAPDVVIDAVIQVVNEAG